MSVEDRKLPPRRLSAEERTLWGRITRSVAPLQRRPPPAEPLGAPAASAKTKLPVRPHRTTHGALPAPKPVPRLEPLDRRQKQRLARGIQALDARLDLHGRTQGEAYVALLSFLRRAQGDGAKIVLVITGTGARGRAERDGRGVLKRQVPLWLKLPEFRPYVVGFEEAHFGHGGEGALYVRVRRPR